MLPREAAATTTATIRDRLTQAQAAWVNPPTFEVGNLVVPAPFIESPTHRPGYDRPRNSVEGIVMETAPSLRKFLGDPELPDCQGILVAFMTSKGEIGRMWIGAWEYVLAPAEPQSA